MINKNNTQKIIHSFLVYVILFFFIVLNILDFLDLFSIINFLNPGDVDFLKKIISWGIIIYLFSNVSLTSLLTGFKSKFYDFIIILGSSLIVIPSLLIFYLKSISFTNYSIFSFMMNSLFLEQLIQYSQIFNTMGVIIILLVSVLIFLKLPITQNSFVGSVLLCGKKSYFSQLFKLFLIISFILFFAFTYFKFFMEWFALAVDAVLLVIGVIYYIYIYVFKHEKELKLNYFLRDIVNTGNNFFKELLIYLNNKNTILISVALLLSAHLLVDVGVYMIPFATGIDNSLYDVLDNDQTQIKPLFGADSWIVHQYQELSQNPNFQNMGINIGSFVFYLVLLLEVIMYCLNLLVFSILLIMPFILIYLYLKKDVFIPSKFNILLILSMVILQLFLLYSPILNNAIQFSISNSQDTQGIVFITQGLFENISSVGVGKIINTIISLFVATGFIFTMLYLKYEKYKQFWVSIYYIIILVFFLMYATIFAQSYITYQFSNYHLSPSEELYENSKEYKKYSEMIFESDNSYTQNKIELRDYPNIKANQYIDVSGPSFVKIEINRPNYIINKYFSDRYEKSSTKIYVKDYADIFGINKPQKIESIMKLDNNKIVGEQELVSFIKNSNLISAKYEITLELMSMVITTIIISIFYIAGLIGYALLYRNMLNDLKRKIF